MRLELLVRPVSAPMKELISQNLKRELARPGRLRRRCYLLVLSSRTRLLLLLRFPLRLGGLLLQRHLDAEHGPFLGHNLDAVPRGDNLKDEAGVLDDDAADADAAGARAADDLDLGAVHLRGAQLGRGRLPAGVQLVAEEFADVAPPEAEERFVEGVALAVARDVVQAEAAAGAGGKGRGFLFGAGEGALFAGSAAGFASVVRRGGRRAEVEGAVLDLVVEDAGGRVGGMGPREERFC